MDFMNSPISWLEWTGIHMSPWKVIGLTGALMFGCRWAVQFVASKRAGKPVIPRVFWYMSIVGSLMTLSYFIFSSKQDSVGILWHRACAAGFFGGTRRLTWRKTPPRGSFSTKFRKV